jgi:predicted type IV restriction endonuclease
MSDDHLSRLQSAIQEVVAKVQRFQDRSLGEQNTKASLIEPILEALGWDIRDPDEVHREFKPTPRDSPVDYALSLFRKPRLFVEAKGLGEDLADRKWIAQMLGYAVVAGVEWCILSDGNEYRFYNATADVDAEEKLFHQVKLSDDKPEVAAEKLILVARDNMEGNRLEELWKAFFVDRLVKQLLLELLTGPDKGLIRLLRRKTTKLTPKEIIDSLRRIDFRIESPSPALGPTDPANEPKSGRSKAGRKRQHERPKKAYGVGLDDLIAAHLIAVPTRLFRRYKGGTLEATLLPDGKVEFQGTHYDSCSTAAEIARGTITGHRMNTNGWSFWQYLDPDGKKTTLFDVRAKYLKMKRQTEEG